MAKAREENARKHLEAAKEHESTGWFKWTPDWVLAAVEYEKAAACYKQIGEYAKARQCYEKQAKARVEMGQPFSAGQALQRAGEAQSNVDGKDAAIITASLYARAASHYEEEPGKENKSADMYSRACKAVGKYDYSLAHGYIQNALSYQDTPENLRRQGQELFRTAVTFYVRNQKYDEATLLFRRYLPLYIELKQRHNVHKGIVSMIILLLAQDDSTGADEVFMKYMYGDTEAMGFGGTDDCKLSNTLLSAFENGDVPALEEAANNQLITFLLPPVSRLAHTLVSMAKNDKLPSFGLKFAGGHKTLGSLGVPVEPFPVDLLSGHDDDDKGKLLGPTKTERSAPANPSVCSPEEELRRQKMELLFGASSHGGG
eukprot:CAMPEP_0119123438 /NCGR_PEP_ID=MMETSP1310-20130426/3388_1 /TAXON_ID=464262 /ORGANISM="Genus nov. species nov., Strain RCC2339" /LENGTH=371 /DNA_ID=CAMNT_0007113255 /DNA_START=201 /DNA_END=1313 /DNA_ORIENTATION=+